MIIGDIEGKKVMTEVKVMTKATYEDMTKVETKAMANVETCVKL